MSEKKGTSSSDSKQSDKSVNGKDKSSDNKEKEKGKEKDGKDKKPEVKKELTEEDLKLKSDLDLLVSIVKEEKKATQQELEFRTVQKNALEQLRKEIRTSTGSMTALPKPLKFLRAHYADLKTFYTTMERTANKALLGEILSVLGMSVPAASEARESLTLKLQSRGLVTELKLPKETIGEWGHEYVRHLSGEIGKEYSIRSEASPAGNVEELLEMVDEIVPFFLAHNAEYDAIDLLLESEGIQKITSQISADNCDRIGKYLLKCVDYILDPEEQSKIFAVAYEGFLKFKFFADALRVSMRLADKEKMLAVFTACEDDKLMQKQLAFLLGSQKIVLDQLKDDEELFKCMGNSQMFSYYQHLAADLDVKEPKSVEDITKPHLEGEGGRRNIRAQPTKESGVDNAKQNLAGTFINAFVNCGFGKDLLVTPAGSEWLYRNKTHGMLSAAASLGMIMLWDVESGFSAVDRFSFAPESFIKAGSALAHGILSSGVTSEMDAAQALLSEHLESKDIDLKVSAILGLGLAYAGTLREDVLEQLVPILVQAGQSMEVVSSVCLSLGLVFCGSANEEISGNIVEAFLDHITDLKDSTARMMCLGMGLLFLGKGENVEGALQALKVIDDPLNKYLAVVVETCAYAGSGSVLQIQKLLNVCAEHFPEDEDEDKDKDKKSEEKKGAEEKKNEEKKETGKDKEKEKKEKDPLRGMHQEAAVLGIAAVALGEELSQEMALRALDHILQYAEVNIRRVVPFAIALLSLSWPRVTVVDTLTKLSHDQDQMVSQNAVLALGFVGAGTNNSRIATQLRNLASYYKNEPNHLFLIRLAQGLLHMGKGLLTLNPISHDGFLLNKVALSGILVVMHASLDLKNSLLSKRHYLLYSLVTAIRPRMLMMLDENLKPIPVSVRVGQKVDIVGMAGKPKSITGFQTHTTPVLISVGERAELANDEFIPLSSVLEGFVIVRKNPNYVDDKSKSTSTTAKDSKK